MTRRQPKYILAIDEYGRDEVFTLGMALLTPAQAATLARRWIKLQQHMKAELLKAAPELSEHPKLTGEQLPEIHAAWLTHSTEYYRKPIKYDRAFWKNYIIWLEEAAKIIRHIAPVLFFVTNLDHVKNNTDAIEETIKVLRDACTKEIGHCSESFLEEYKSIMLNPYPVTFSKGLGAVNTYLSSKNKTARIVCDNYDQCKGFSELEVYKVLAEYDRFQFSGTPEFTSSTDNVLVQMIDVAAYIQGKRGYVNFNPEKADPKSILVGSFYPKYLERLDYPRRNKALPVNQTLGLAIYREFITLHPKGSEEMRRLMRTAHEHGLSELRSALQAGEDLLPPGEIGSVNK